MKKYLLTMLIAFVFSIVAFAQPDIIVLNNGTVLNVYNLDYSPADKCYYTLDEAGEQMKSVPKADVMIIKLADGTKIDPNATAVAPQAAAPVNEANVVKNPAEHEAVTYEAKTDFYKDKKGNTVVCVEDLNGYEIFMRLLSDEDRTLAVTKPQGKVKYDKAEYIIPEYVKIGNNKYTVVAIDDEAFLKVASNTGKGFNALIAFGGGNDNIKHIKFPLTLKRIGKRAFFQNSGIDEIILPEGLEEIGKDAFGLVGVSCKTFKQLYLPKSVKTIGSDAFRFVGPNTSPKGYFQGTLSSMPNYITTGNCTSYGIDEEAVEAYERRNRK